MLISLNRIDAFGKINEIKSCDEWFCLVILFAYLNKLGNCQMNLHHPIDIESWEIWPTSKNNFLKLWKFFAGFDSVLKISIIKGSVPSLSEAEINESI